MLGARPSTSLSIDLARFVVGVLMFLVHNSPEQASLLASALVQVHRPGGVWYAPSQADLAHTLFLKLLGVEIDFNSHPGLAPAFVSTSLNTPGERQELLELLIAFEMLCNPIPAALADDIDSWAETLDVQSDCLLMSRDLARNAIAQATSDFYRLNWIGEGDHQDDPAFQHLVQQYGDHAYGLCVEADPDEFSKWNQLQTLPPGSLGRRLWEFYQARGFKLPGELGAGNAALAHHDWIHLIAGYDTTPIGELEVTSFMASSSHSPGAILGFIGAISILETGLLHSFYGADKFGLALSSGDGIARVASSIQRGKACLVDPLLDVDYFAIADQPLVDIQRQWWAV
jgi:hypothetical protein